MKLASSTLSQDFAVGCEMPQSLASEERFSNCAVRPAHNSRNLWNVSSSPMLRMERTSRSR